jgi:phosphonate transport system substrate-binding protein
MKRTLSWVSMLAPSIAPVYEFTARFVSNKLGYESTFSNGRSYSEFASGVVDVGFICGQPYVEIQRETPGVIEPVVAPILVGDRYGGRPIYFSDVIVNAKSEISSWRDLRGRSWSYNEPRSHSGYNVVGHRLAEMAAGPDFFGRIVEAGWHQRSIDLVESGEVDASAIDSQVLEVELRARPELKELIKVIDVLGPSTIQPVVASTALDPGLRHDIKQVLVEMSAHPEAQEILARAMMARWREIEDADYDDIRSMLAAVERAGISLREAANRVAVSPSP